MNSPTAAGESMSQIGALQAQIDMLKRDNKSLKGTVKRYRLIMNEGLQKPQAPAKSPRARNDEYSPERSFVVGGANPPDSPHGGDTQSNEL